MPDGFHSESSESDPRGALEALLGALSSQEVDRVLPDASGWFFRQPLCLFPAAPECAPAGVEPCLTQLPEGPILIATGSAVAARATNWCPGVVSCQGCSTSTILAGSCCLTDKCYRNLSAWDHFQPAPIPATNVHPMQFHWKRGRPVYSP